MPYNKLKGRIVEKYGTRKEFAKATGLTATTLSHKLSGKTYISQSDVKKWCELLDIDLSEIGEYFFG